MANFRQIHVSIWKDPWFLDLEPDEKLLFIYLFSNESTSLAGIYEIAFRVICFETNLDQQYVRDTLAKFEEAEKVFYRDGIVWVKNLRKYNSSTSEKVLIRIKNDLDEIPDCELKQLYIAYYDENIPYPYPSDTPSYEEEEEKEEEKEDETEEPEEDELTTPTPHSLLSVTFVNKTQIPEFNGGAQKWNDATRRMVQAGVEPVDVETAVDELLNSKNNYTIVGIQSVENAAYSAMAKRKNSKGKNKRDRVVDDSPERRRKYAEDLAKYTGD